VRNGRRKSLPMEGVETRANEGDPPAGYGLANHWSLRGISNAGSRLGGEGGMERVIGTWGWITGDVNLVLELLDTGMSN